MILLESKNRVIAETLKTVLIPDIDYRPAPFEVKLCDFDNASFKVEMKQDQYDEISLSLALPCFYQIKDAGAQTAAETAFGSWLNSTASTGYDLTVTVTRKDWEGKEQSVINTLSNMKGIILGGVFENYYESLNRNVKLAPFKFDLRPDTTVFLVPGNARVVTIFQLRFQDKADMEIGRVFLSEFADPQMQKKIQKCPPISFDVNPPAELKEFNITTPNKLDLGYVSFAILPIHVSNTSRPKLVEQMQTFRNFVQYHMKCAKAFFHSRMRFRVVELVKVLNRAKCTSDEQNAPKKIVNAQGKTFVRK